MVGSNNGGGRRALPTYALKESTLTHNISKEELEARQTEEAKINKNISATLKPFPGLSAGARKIWRETLEQINNSEVELINNLDVAVFTDYCVNYDLYKKALKQLASIQVFSQKRYVASPDKEIQNLMNNCYKVLKQSGAAMTRAAGQLCLTPSARAAMAAKRAKAKKEDDGIIGWLNK